MRGMLMPVDELKTCDAVCLTGGASCLPERIYDTGSRDTLRTPIREDGFVIGASAGSSLFANDLPGNPGLPDTKPDVNSAISSRTGSVSFPPVGNMKLPIRIRSMPEDVKIIDG